MAYCDRGFQRELWEQRGLFHHLDALEMHGQQQHENYEFLRNRLCQSNAAVAANDTLGASAMAAKWKQDVDSWPSFRKVVVKPPATEKLGSDTERTTSEPLPMADEIHEAAQDEKPASDTASPKTERVDSAVELASSKTS